MKKWYATCMSWDPEKFGGKTRMTLPKDLMWVPDIALVNT